MATLAVSEPAPPAPAATGGKGICAIVMYEYEVCLNLYNKANQGLISVILGYRR